MHRTRLTAAACPIARSLDLIGDWWSLLIVRDALGGVRRFSAFQKNLGVSKNILARRLRALVADGIFALAPAEDGSVYQDYVLTEKGRALFPVLVALRQWGTAHAFGDDACGNVLVDRRDGAPVQPMQVHAADGRPVAAADVEVKPNAHAGRPVRPRGVRPDGLVPSTTNRAGRP